MPLPLQIFLFLALLVGFFLAGRSLIGKPQSSLSTDPSLPDTPPDKDTLFTPLKEAGPRRRLLGIGAIAACALLLGLSHVLSRKLVLEAVDPFLAVGLRNLIAGSLIFLLAGLARHFSPLEHRSLRFDRWTWLAIFGRSISGICYFAGLLSITATAGIMLYRLNPIYTLALAYWLTPTAHRREVAILPLAVGTLLAIGGAMLGAITPGGDIGAGTTAWHGVVLMLIAAPFWSLFLISWEKHRASRVDDTDFASRQRYVAQIDLMAAVPMIAIGIVIAWTQSGDGLRPEHWRQLILLSGITALIGILYFESVKRIGALLASIIVGAEVYFTILFEAWILGQPGSSLSMLGATILIAGAILVARQNRALIRQL